MINKVIIIGRLGKAPETTEKNGLIITRCNIATTEQWKGEEKTEWHKVVMFGKLAEIAGHYLDKGSLVYIEGRLQTRSWEQDGATRYITEIVANQMKMLDGKGGQKKERGDNQGDDDIPF